LPTSANNIRTPIGYLDLSENPSELEISRVSAPFEELLKQRPL